VDLLGRANRGVIETVPQTTNDSQHVNSARRLKNNFQKHLAFNALGAGFLSVDGNGLGKDFRRDDFLLRRSGRTRLNRGRRGNISIAEPGLPDGGARSRASVGNSNAAAEASAGDYSANALGAAGTVA